MKTVDQKLISVFRNKWDNGLDKEGNPDPRRLPDIDIDEFIEGVRSGRWAREVAHVRAAIGDKTEYDRRKSQVVGVTIWGTFVSRKATNADVPSGLMATDLDHLSEEELTRCFNLLRMDPYVYSIFRSIGGKGLCVIFRVDPERWIDSFEGIRIYLTEAYGLVMGWDESVKDISRLRYVSHDSQTPPINHKAQLFRKYPRKEKKEVKKPNFIHTENDIRYILDQIHGRSLDLTERYEDWYRIGWALISAYGEEARGIFHEVSGYNAGYDADACDKKFKYLIDTRPARITIATFYWYCRQAGLDIMTPQTRTVVSVAAMSKKQKISKASALDTVLSQTDADAATATPIIDQVYASLDEFDTQETLFDQLELFLKSNYPMRRNGITRYIETPDGAVYEEKDFNTIYIAARKAVDDKLKYHDMERLIRSDFTVTYNPFTEFIARNKSRKPEGLIRQLSETILTSTGLEGSDFAPDYAYFFVRKWLLGLMDSMHGGHSPLVLVFTGGLNIGKTEWFRRLLPDELHPYYGESELDKGQDDEILMCKKLILFNDEFGGMTRRDTKRFKSLTSKQTFSLREPYGRAHVDMNRIAVLCGSCNEDDVLNDPTGNRRVVPIHATGFDRKVYNNIDKIDLLMEVYHAYKDGERHHLTMEDVKMLSENTRRFEDLNVERELIQKYYTVPEDPKGMNAMFLSATEIKVFLEKVSQQRVGIKRLAQELTRAGFVGNDRKIKGKVKFGYAVVSETEHAGVDVGF